MIKEKRLIKYIAPVKIATFEGNFNNVNELLKEDDDQIAIYEPECLEIKGQGYIVLDFGEEVAGGLRILTNTFKSETEIFHLRIRFGESISETFSEIGEKGATNNHSIRDMNVITTALSDQCYGDTGFRFVRIDFLDENTTVRIKRIFAKCWYNDFKLLNDFHSNDELLNKIFDTSKHTLDLCVQGRIWDGIKRDRLVWIGDMEPEIHAILHLYGNIEEIESSIISAEKHNPLPSWMNGIPSYSMWYIVIISEILKYTKDILFYKRHEEYLNKVISLLNKGITKEGSLDFLNVKECPSESYFIDWPGSIGTKEERISANKNLLVYSLNEYKNTLTELGVETNNIDDMLTRLTTTKTNVPSLSQFAAFHYLVNHDDESYNVLINNGANGMTTFMSYFILKAIADRDFDAAIKILKEYYGAMIDVGATTFFEDFSLSWLNNSIKIDELPDNNRDNFHGDHGQFCYVGFRHSLCHGWSCGPISFLIENKEKIYE